MKLETMYCAPASVRQKGGAQELAQGLGMGNLWVEEEPTGFAMVTVEKSAVAEAKTRVERCIIIVNADDTSACRLFGWV